MKVNWKLIIPLTAQLVASYELKAEVKSSLFLRAFILPTINTQVKESRISSFQSLWLISSQNNSRFPTEGQKFELVGVDQSIVDAHIKKIVSKDRTIQYEILISRLKSSLPSNKPIFLKISAN